jgi:hypothetical protein
MDHHCRTSVANERSRSRPNGCSFGHGVNGRFAISRYCNISQVARMWALGILFAVLLSRWIEVLTGRLEVGRSTLTSLMDVDSMESLR